MVTRAEIGIALGRVRNAYPQADVQLVCMALERYLVGEGRRGVFDKRAYQRGYMRRYRAGEVGGKRNRNRKRAR